MLPRVLLLLISSMDLRIMCLVFVEVFLNPFCGIFEHDNGSKHIAKLVKRWLSIYKVDVLIWPS